VDVIVRHAKRIIEPTARVRQTISNLITATNDPAFALAHLGVFTKIKLLEPYVALLQHATGRKGSNQAAVKVDGESIKRILDTDSAAGYELIKTLVDISPSATKSFVDVLEADEALLEKEELLDSLRIIVALPNAGSQDQGAVIANAAVESIKRSVSIDQSAPARGILRDLATVSPDRTNSTLLDIPMSAYNASFARLARDIAGVDTAEQGVQGLVKVGLLFLTRLASSTVKLEESHLGMFADLGTSTYY
jgi:hypothetical protein